MAKRQSPEKKVHEDVLAYLRLKFPKAVIHHSPNEFGASGKEIARQIAKHKKMGMAVGFPDLIALTDKGPMLFEVKAEGNYATESQKALHSDLDALGYRVAVVRSVDDVREKLAAWGFIGSETRQ